MEGVWCDETWGFGIWFFIGIWCWYWWWWYELAVVAPASARANISLTWANFETDDGDGDGDRFASVTWWRDCTDGREARKSVGGGGGRAMDDVITDGLIEIGALGGGGNGGDKHVNDDGNGNGGGGGNKNGENFCAYLLLFTEGISRDFEGTP